MMRGPLATVQPAISLILGDATTSTRRGNGTPRNGESPLAARAKEIYEARRRRHDLLPEAADLFHEPAWDLLLDLFIAREKGDVVAVSSACIGAAVPATTGLRVLAALAERGAVLIEPDPFDKRRKIVRLSDATRRRMSEFLSRW